LTAKARAERPWLTVEWLPRYAPELNDIELAWRDLKRHHLAHRTFSDAQQLEATIRSSIAVINRERMKAQDVTTYKLLLSMDGGGPVSEGEVESELVELFGVRCWARRCCWARSKWSAPRSR
jgi:hypothetical protein